MKKLFLAICAIIFTLLTLKGQESDKKEIGHFKYIGYFYGKIAVREDKSWNTYLIVEPDRPKEKKTYRLLINGNKSFVNNYRTKIKYIKDDLRISTKVIKDTPGTSSNFSYKYELIIRSNKY